jgi:hypothetical protein
MQLSVNYGGMQSQTGVSLAVSDVEQSSCGEMSGTFVPVL